MNIILRATSKREISATHQGPGSEVIRDLFSSDTLPTAFHFQGVKDIDAHMAYVLAEIQKLNPTATVVWDYASVRFLTEAL